MTQDSKEKRYFRDGTYVIWRYLDLAKLISTLKTESLWFARADTLEDAHEGALIGLAQQVRDNPARAKAANIDMERLLVTIEGWHEESRSSTFVNCWHRTPTESMAMWKIYSGSGLGVAVKSTAPKVLQALRKGHVWPERELQYGIVRYGTLSAPTDDDPLLEPFLRKRDAFEFEQELRFLYRAEEPDPPLGPAWKVDLTQVIDGVFVAPGTPDWGLDAVRAVVRALGPPGVVVSRSGLDGRPAY